MGVARKMLDRVDRGVGAGLERLVRGHHHRRLRRLGHTSVFEFAAGSGLWAQTDPPPRPGNSVEVLVDGERACGAIAKALAGAHSQVHIAGWHLTPGFELTRDGDTSTLRDILARLAERVDVRVLLGAGPPSSAASASTRCRETDGTVLSTPLAEASVGTMSPPSCAARSSLMWPITSGRAGRRPPGSRGPCPSCPRRPGM